MADAVGNSLPPPSIVPATVGSPVNLLTPDRYEFYTFDDSGELVKRLMTLEEIQAIVAAGEDNESLVTFANDDPPTVSFNVEQPPYNKVHSVVTNVQNVLKAQMEAHKNRPLVQPTLDTPDVSDSWSLILPSIFGNTGVDIVLDKASVAVTTPETETIEEGIQGDENLLSKEGDNQVLTSSTLAVDENIELIGKTTPKVTTTSTISIKTTTTTLAPTTAITANPSSITPKVTATTPKPTTTSIKLTSTTVKPTTTTLKPTTAKIAITSTGKPVIATTKKPLPTTRITTANVLQTKTTTKPRTTLRTVVPTTIKPIIRTTHKITTLRPQLTTQRHIVSVSTPTNDKEINVKVQTNANTISSTEKNKIEFERISTFIPLSTVKYVSERTTRKPVVSTEVPFISTRPTTKEYTSETPTTQTIKAELLETTFNPALSTERIQNEEKINTTTITTQSVSPSTTVSSTEFLSADKVNLPSDVEENNEGNLPLFDVAQSISQIASDLGGSYQPFPTTNNLLENSNESQLNLESKENLDIDIPSSTGNDTDVKISDGKDRNEDNFVKISTIDPHSTNKVKEDNISIKNLTGIKDIPIKEISNNDKANIIIDSVQKIELSSTPPTTESTTIDPILSESMGDLLSQVVNQSPTIVDSEKQQEEILTTVGENQTPATVGNSEEATSEISLKVKKDTSSTTENPGLESEKERVKGKDTVTKINLNIRDDVPKQENVEKISKPDEIITPVNETVVNNHTQLSETINKVGSIVDTSENKLNITKETPALSNIDMKEEVLKSDIPKIENYNEVSEPELDREITTEAAATLPNLDSDIKIITTNKVIPSTINKITLNEKIASTNKNGKLPEPLPKVDDFRKKIQKVNIDEEELIRHRNNSWKLIPTLSPPKVNEILKEKVKSDDQHSHENNGNKDVVLEFSNENQGLEVTTKDLGEDVARFTELSNELAFRYWSVIIDEIEKRRSFVFSPYSTFSMLAMIFMGARGSTSGEMNEILKLDDMITFNPHFALKNISDSIETSPKSGVAVSAFARELYSDRNKGKILTFYKERAQHFYNGHVEEINFKLISDIIRRRTNLLVKRYTWGKMPEFMKTNNIVMQPPLAAFTANIFQVGVCFSFLIS